MDEMEKAIKATEDIGKNGSHYLLYAIREQVKSIPDKKMKLSCELIMFQYSIIYMMKVFLDALKKTSPNLEKKIKADFLVLIKRFIADEENV